MKNNPGEKQFVSERDFFSVMSESDLEGLGVGDVAYVKRHIVRGHAAFVLYAADGTALAAQDNESAVKQSAHHQDLELVAVH